MTELLLIVGGSVFGVLGQLLLIVGGSVFGVLGQTKRPLHPARPAAP